ncbi:hypothetical protein GCM10028803_21930 [Larkinella knui]|uniref:Type VI secretion system tip protein VgrG n=1 Tax=Larkinella knui TaxID=2025310 RepID=A0A3P1CVH5_9BACT|nr:type VI secretion system tip protein VgrG [Larkinella knui]RRB17269.1 type VI secretion system tip protein VgrG [Larkinella knui]
MVPPIVAPDADVITFSVKINDRELGDDYPILGIRVRKELNRIASARLHLLETDVAAAAFTTDDPAVFRPGQPVEILMGYHGETQTVFKGIIVQNQNDAEEETETGLILECRDQAFRMTAPLQSRHFNDLTDTDLAEQLLAGNELRDTEIEASSLMHAEITQHNQSDWDFVVSRLDAIGYSCLTNDNRLIARPLPTALPDSAVVATFTYGENLIAFSSETDARTQPNGVTVASWDPQNQEVQETEASEPAQTGQGGNVDASVLSNASGNRPLHISYPGRLTRQEQQALADARLLKSRLSRVRGRLKTTGTTTVLPGQIIRIERIGGRFDGNHLVSAVEQEFENGGWVTIIRFGLPSEQFFAETIQPQSPTAAVGALSATPGLQIGVVTQIDNDPQGEFRVKVRLPLIDAAGEGIWTRVATLDAGNGRGTFFYPEIDDEVIIGFISNDLRNPVLMGMLHSSAKPAPLTPAAQNPEKGYVSREGMKVVFNDDQKSVTILTPGGNTLMVSDNDRKVQVEDQSGNTIVLDGGGVTIQSTSRVTIKASGNLSIEGTQISIQATGVLELKGALVQIN